MPILDGSFSKDDLLNLNVKDVSTLLIALVFACIYRAINPRKTFYCFVWGPVPGHLSKSLKQTASHGGLSHRDWQDANSTHRGAESTFWKLVGDSDALSKKSERIRFNGTVLTAFYDAYLLTMVAALITLALCLAISNNFYGNLSVVYMAISLCCLLGMSKLQKNHVSLIDEQIDILGANHTPEFVQHLREQAKRNRLALEAPH